MKNETGIVTQNKERIAWIDTAKFICIIMVLFSHMEYVPSYLQCVFKPFFLTTFFFLTGYVFNSKRTFRQFLCNRICTLLVPALLFSLIYLLDFKSILQFNYSLSQFFDDISVLARQQRGQGDMLWFLYVSFLAEIPLFFMDKYIKNKKVSLLVSFILCEMSIVYVKHFMTNVPYWYIHVVFVAMFFMVVGSFFKENEYKVKALLENTYVLIGVACVYIAVVFVLFYKFNAFVNINEYSANQIIWFFTVFAGIYLCVAVAKKIPSNRLILYCGKSTLIFYLLHDRVRGIINAVLKKTPLWNIVFENDITKTLTVVVVCCVEVAFLMILSEIIVRYFPFVIGKKYSHRKKLTD